jgi:hypothetical protein
MSNIIPSVATADHVASRDSVVQFSDFPRRRQLRSFERDERRGVLLLFTGIRYERQIEPDETAAEDGLGALLRRG